MHAAPAFQVAVRHFGIWRGAVAGAAALDLVTIAAWFFERAASVDIAPSSLAFGAVLAATAGLASVLVAASLIRILPSTLRWDGQVWRLASTEASPAESPTGTLTVAIDLGRWLLLRFVPDGPAPAGPAAAPARWLPVQRRGIESQWHALRCSVFGTRPRSINDDKPINGI